MKQLFVFVLMSVFVVSGCANSQPTMTDQVKPKSILQECACEDTIETKQVVKEVDKYVSQCARRVDTIVYQPVCKNCGGYAVSVRRNNCCVEGACK